MKVFLVSYTNLGIDGDIPISVWTSRELAEAEIGREEKKARCYSGDEYTITEFDLDEVA